MIFRELLHAPVPRAYSALYNLILMYMWKKCACVMGATRTSIRKLRTSIYVVCFNYVACTLILRRRVPKELCLRQNCRRFKTGSYFVVQYSFFSPKKLCRKLVCCQWHLSALNNVEIHSFIYIHTYIYNAITNFF